MNNSKLENRIVGCLKKRGCNNEDRITCLLSDFKEARNDMEEHGFIKEYKSKTCICIDLDTWLKWFGDNNNCNNEKGAKKDE